jgi:hypothetical protein
MGHEVAVDFDFECCVGGGSILATKVRYLPPCWRGLPNWHRSSCGALAPGLGSHSVIMPTKGPTGNYRIDF